jgi:MSHA type pilus biogenesis protein MshL
MLYLLLLCILFSGGCRELANRKDIGPKVGPEDVRNIVVPEEPKKEATPEKPAVETEKAPQYPSSFNQKVSITLSENQNIKPVLIELARQAGVDLTLDPSISAQIVYSANKRSFIEVIEQVCDMANLRYTINQNSLKIEPDTPFSKNYNVQFLNLNRKSQNKASIATDVFSKGKDEKSTTNDNGSNTAVDVSGQNDFWAELEGNLGILLGGGTKEGNKPNYSLHKQAGIITVLATSKYHRLVEDYLKKIRQAASSQVLIEAKIIEVVLRDEFKSGINWQKIGQRNDLRFTGKFGDRASASKFLPSSTSSSEMISLGATGKNFSGLLNALDEFGYSRTLSSPRLTVMNNQTAILKVAQNQVYFRLNYDKHLGTTLERDSVSVSSDIQTVPIGLVMSVQPSIDADTGEIILFLRPTISRLSDSIRDPAVDIALSSNEVGDIKPSVVPVVEVREIDSVLRLQNGEIAIMGGLMEVRTFDDTSKLPFLGDAPYLGDLFKSRTDGSYVVELVILLKATIAEDGHGFGVDASDSRLQKMMPDPRPFNS